MKYLSLIAVLFALSSCGFSPMYGTASKTDGNSQQSGSVKSNLSQIEIDIIPDRSGQFLRNALIDQFYTSGTPTNAPYRLKIDRINESVSDFDITIESEATRRQLRLTTKMALYDTQNDTKIMERSLVAITSHNVLESEFSTLVTEQSARDAALNDLARQVERQLALYFNQ